MGYQYSSLIELHRNQFIHVLHDSLNIQHSSSMWELWAFLLLWLGTLLVMPNGILGDNWRYSLLIFSQSFFRDVEGKLLALHWSFLFLFNSFVLCFISDFLDKEVYFSILCTVTSIQLFGFRGSLAGGKTVITQKFWENDWMFLITFSQQIIPSCICCSSILSQ